MRTLRTAVIALTVLAIAACTRESSSDLIIRQRTNAGGSGGHMREVTIYVQGKKRVDDYERLRKIVDLEAKTLTTVYKERKTYTLRTFDQMREQAAAVQKRLEALPPQAQQLIANLAGQNEPLRLKPTGKSDKIAGYDANEYAIEGGAGGGSVWTTDALDVPREGRDWELFNASLGGFQDPDQQLAQAMGDLKGFPLRAELKAEIGKQKLTLTTETLDVRRETVPADVLSVPEGFTRTEVPGVARPRQQ